MKKFKLLSLLLIISLFAGILSIPALAVDDPVTAAQSVVLLDADTGSTLYEKNADISFDPGKLVMLMTALVLGDSLDRQDIRLDDVVTQSGAWRYNTTDASVLAGYGDGDSFTVNDLLHISVLCSTEDTANGLAQYAYSTPDAFVAEMNRRAQEIGCAGSSFVNAGGTYADAQRSTAHDLAIIARTVFQSESVLPAFEAESYTVPPTVSYTSEWAITTDNALINSTDSRHYEMAYAGKAAFTGLGASVVAAATYNGLDVIAVVIGCPEGTDQFVEAKNLFDWVFANFGYHTLVGSTDVLETIPVSMGSPDSVGVRASDTIQMLMPNDQEPSDISLDLVYAHEQEGTELQAPISVGDYLGELTVTVGGQVQGTSRLVAATAVDISRLNYLRSQLDVLLQNQSVRQIITILLGALGVYLLLVVVYVIQRIVHLHSLRRARKARARSRAQEELGWLEVPEEAPQIEDGGYIRQGGPAAPVDFREEPAEEDEPEDELPAEDGEAPEEETPAEEEVPAEEGEEFTEEEAPAEDGEGFVEEAPAEESYYEDDGEYYEDENDYYEDEDGGESQGKRRWWKRK